MKKTVWAIAVLAIATVSCKKEEAKPTEPSQELQEVPLAEKVTYQPKLEWTAFKTPEKVGVKGTFNTIELNGAKDSGNIEQDIKEATFKIVSSSVNTTDPLRDGKLKDAFFAVMTGDITGKFIDFKEGKAKVEITMNSVTATKEFSYTATGDVLKMNGSIDIITDFKADKAFKSIHELCKELHAGKTWTDVEIAVEISKK